MAVELKFFVEYFLRNWMVDENKFQINMWNHHMNYGPRTNNHLEGWHHTLNKNAGVLTRIFMNSSEFLKKSKKNLKPKF